MLAGRRVLTTAADTLPRQCRQHHRYCFGKTVETVPLTISTRRLCLVRPRRVLQMPSLHRGVFHPSEYLKERGEGFYRKWGVKARLHLLCYWPNTLINHSLIFEVVARMFRLIFWEWKECASVGYEAICNENALIFLIAHAEVDPFEVVGSVNTNHLTFDVPASVLEVPC